jgi:hypothetical protein
MASMMLHQDLCRSQVLQQQAVQHMQRSMRYGEIIIIDRTSTDKVHDPPERQLNI